MWGLCLSLFLHSAGKGNNDEEQHDDADAGDDADER